MKISGTNLSTVIWHLTMSVQSECWIIYAYFHNSGILLTTIVLFHAIIAITWMLWLWRRNRKDIAIINSIDPELLEVFNYLISKSRIAKFWVSHENVKLHSDKFEIVVSARGLKLIPKLAGYINVSLSNTYVDIEVTNTNCKTITELIAATTSHKICMADQGSLDTAAQYIKNSKLKLIEDAKNVPRKD